MSAPMAAKPGCTREYIGIKPHRPKKSMHVKATTGPQLDSGGVIIAMWAGREMTSCRLSLDKGRFLKARFIDDEDAKLQVRETTE